MINRNTLIKIAILEAEKSDNKHRLGCIIFNKNIILSVGHNTSLESRKKLHPKFRRWPNSIHAEVAAILNARTDLNNCSLFIIRINKNYEPLLAKPCEYCRNYIEYVGIRKIIYSSKDGWIEENL